MTQTDADAHLFCCPRCHAYFDFCASVGRVTLENVLNYLPELRVTVRVTAWVTRSYIHQLTTITHEMIKKGSRVIGEGDKGAKREQKGAKREPHVSVAG